MKACMKISICLTFFTILILSSNNSWAQKYGGSAYVHVKDDKGNARTLNAVAGCISLSESSAKSSLKASLESERKYNEEFESQVYYSIDQCSNDDDKKYGGSASVKVRDDDGNERVLNTTTGCIGLTASSAKSSLKAGLEGEGFVADAFNGPLQARKF